MFRGTSTVGSAKLGVILCPGWVKYELRKFYFGFVVPTLNFNVRCAKPWERLPLAKYVNQPRAPLPNQLQCGTVSQGKELFYNTWPNRLTDSHSICTAQELYWALCIGGNYQSTEPELLLPIVRDHWGLINNCCDLRGMKSFRADNSNGVYQIFAIPHILYTYKSNMHCVPIGRSTLIESVYNCVSI